MEVSHLVFAYDTIILYDATKEQMELLELDIDVVWSDLRSKDKFGEKWVDSYQGDCQCGRSR